MYAEDLNTPQRMTEAEYLAFADQQDIKYEYRDGYVYAMVGGTANHSIITVNTSTQFNVQLSDKNCTVTSPDLRVYIASKQTYRYPDVAVFCGEMNYLHDDRRDTLTNPIVLVEVLSPSTAQTDYNEKLTEYTQIDSLQAYLLISQDTPKVERFLRAESGQWLYDYALGLDSQITVPPVDCTLALSALYNKVNWDEDE